MTEPIEPACQRCGRMLEKPGELCPRCLLQPSWDVPDRQAVTLGPGRSFTPPSVEALNEHLVGYRVSELLGRGGMGPVYRGEQLSLDRAVAIKVLPPSVASREGFAERFAREGRALARLNHPHIVAVHDFGVAGPYAILVMELVDGANLRDVLRQGKLSPRESLAIVPQLCDALSYAHGEGVVHRDIKPENLLFDAAGRLKITDFGLAKIIRPVAAPEPADSRSDESSPDGGTDDQSVAKDEETRGRSADQVVGTIHYMAPEQYENPAGVDHRADIYAMGVVFYEMLTGELPMGRFDPPSHQVRLDIRIDEVVLRSLDKQPSRRYGSASDVKIAVQKIGPDGSAGHDDPAPPNQPSRWPAEPSLIDRLFHHTQRLFHHTQRLFHHTHRGSRSVVDAAREAWRRSPTATLGGVCIATAVLLTLAGSLAFVIEDDSPLITLPTSILVIIITCRTSLNTLHARGIAASDAPWVTAILAIAYTPLWLIGFLWPAPVTGMLWDEIFGWPRSLQGATVADQFILSVQPFVAIGTMLALWWSLLLLMHLVFPKALSTLFWPLLPRGRRWVLATGILLTLGTAVACGLWLTMTLYSNLDRSNGEHAPPAIAPVLRDAATDLQPSVTTPAEIVEVSPDQ